MISEKLYTEAELYLEKKADSVSKHIEMLEHNNRLLAERLKAAIGFLEMQEGHLKEGVVFFWREIILEQ